MTKMQVMKTATVIACLRMKRQSSSTFTDKRDDFQDWHYFGP